MSKKLKFEQPFPCIRCGACCRNVALSSLTACLDKGNGVCRHLDEQSSLCTIYKMRPDICRIALQYERNFKTHFSWEEFCEVNQRCCTILQVREQIRQQELAEERRNQAIRDACENIAWQFKTELTRVVNENIQSNFSRVNDKLSEIREGLSASQQELSTDRAEIVHALETLKVYV